MNKELIKIYKNEFDHWLNGGRLLSKHINDKDWYETTDPSFSNINVSYVIYDEYVELRKAIIKGKTIQVWDVIYQHLTDPKLDAYDWRDFKSFTQSSPFTYSPERYRVKPEEPQFKVGDFVRVSSPSGVQFVAIITSINKDNTVTLNGNAVAYLSDCTKWESQTNELCWFADSLEQNTAYLGNYKLKNSFGYFTQKHSVAWKHCEPFLNSKPSWFKD